MDDPVQTQKKVYSVRLDESLVKAIKHLAVDLGRNLSDIYAESLRDTLQKYGVELSDTRLPDEPDGKKRRRGSVS
jgi:predicted transcriptional regulator